MSDLNGKKREKAYLDEMAIEAARLFHEEDLTADDIYIKLARQGYDVRSPRDVRSLLDRARPLVNVRVTRADTPVQQDEALAKELVRDTSLRNAIIAKCGKLAGDPRAFLSDDETERAGATQDSDELHRRLGVVAAEYLWQIIADGDRIGVGPGRGVGFTVDALTRLVGDKPPTSFKKDLHVLSLTGGVVRRPLSSTVGATSLDSDDIAQRLGEPLQAELSFVELPLFLEPKKRGLTKDDIVGATMASYLLASDPADPPSVAIFGLNALNEEHYLLQRRNAARIRPDTNVIRSELDQLRDILPRCPHAVLDICVRFIVGLVTDDCEEAAAEIVAGLNSKVVSIAPSKLDKAEQKIVVAGGADKYPAVLSLLTQSLEIHATTLVTDEVTAQRLLRDIQRSKLADGARTSFQRGRPGDGSAIGTL